MKTIILRLNDCSNDVEVLFQEDEQAVIEKVICKEEATKELNSFLKYNVEHELDLMDVRILHVKETASEARYIYLLDEANIKCTYKDKGYSINHPKTIFLIKVDKNKAIFKQVEAYCFKEYLGKRTKLYRYPFPNMYASNSICTGTIQKNFLNPHQTIMDILESNYTHDTTSFKNKKMQMTQAAFKFLSNNPFPYNELESLNYEVEFIMGKQ